MNVEKANEDRRSQILSPRSMRCCVVERPLWDLAIIQISVDDETKDMIPDMLLVIIWFLLCPSFHSTLIAIKSSMSVGSIALDSAIHENKLPMMFVLASQTRSVVLVCIVVRCYGAECI